MTHNELKIAQEMRARCVDLLRQAASEHMGYIDNLGWFAEVLAIRVEELPLEAAESVTVDTTEDV